MSISSPSRRTVAKGLAWAAPTVTAAVVAPYAAASGATCTLNLRPAGGTAFYWGLEGAASTNQVLKQVGSFTAYGLPGDATITQLSITIYTENRIDSNTNFQNSGAYDPGNNFARLYTNRGTDASTTCDTNYATVTGTLACNFTSLYRSGYSSPTDPNYNNPYSLYNTPSGIGPWWQPGTSAATVKMTSNMTSHTFPQAGVTRRAWGVTYTGDASKITSSDFTTTADGCKTFKSMDTAQLEVDYQGVRGPSPQPGKDPLADFVVTFRYTTTDPATKKLRTFEVTRQQDTTYKGPGAQVVKEIL